METPAQNVNSWNQNQDRLDYRNYIILRTYKFFVRNL